MAKSTLKFKDSVAEYERLKGKIAAREFAPIYLLMGTESYFIDQLAQQLADTILDSSCRDFNQVVVYGKDSEVGGVINLARQMPMMGSYQVVILKQAQQLRSIEKLSLYTKNPNPTTIFIICHHEKNVDKRTPLYKSCLSGGVVFESVSPRDYEIGTWLQGFVQRRGLQMNTKSIAMLTDYLGADISKISSELEKLILSIDEGVTKITEDDIERNIGISKEFNNFELCRAVVNLDVARSMRIADHFAQNPKDNPLLLTISALFGEFRRIFLVGYLRWQSQYRKQPFPSDSELMGIVKIGNSFVLGELKQTAAKWNNRKVFQVLGLLREYDAKSKGVNNGGATDGELLRELLLKIFA